MKNGGKSVRDPAAHQPSKVELARDIRIGASPKALAWTSTHGGAARLGSAVKVGDVPTRVHIRGQSNGR